MIKTCVCIINKPHHRSNYAFVYVTIKNSNEYSVAKYSVYGQCGCGLWVVLNAIVLLYMVHVAFENFIHFVNVGSALS